MSLAKRFSRQRLAGVFGHRSKPDENFLQVIAERGAALSRLNDNADFRLSYLPILQAFRDECADVCSRRDASEADLRRVNCRMELLKNITDEYNNAILAGQQAHAEMAKRKPSESPNG